MNKVLLDTCALIWLIKGEFRSLGEDALAIIEDRSVRKVVSTISFLEIATKSCLPRYKGKEILIQDDFKDRILETIEIFDINELELQIEHCERLYGLIYEKTHGDPSDRIIVAKAIMEEASLVSSDGKLEFYGFVEQYKNVWTIPQFGS